MVKGRDLFDRYLLLGWLVQRGTDCKSAAHLRAIFAAIIPNHTVGPLTNYILDIVLV